MRHLLPRIINYVCGHRIKDKPDIFCLAIRYLATRKQHLFGLFRSRPINPHGRRRTPPNACWPISNLSSFWHESHISTQRNIGPNGKSISYDLAKKRLHRTTKRHETLGALPHNTLIGHRIPWYLLNVFIRALGLGKFTKVSTGTER